MNNFRSRMTLFFGGLGLIVSFPVFLYIDQVLSRQLVDDHAKALQEAASYTALVLAENLNERQQEIELLAKSILFRKYNLSDPEVKAALQRRQEFFPNYSWIGVTDTEGAVLSATNNLLVGVNVSKRPWFTAGKQATSVLDIHEALLLSKLLNNPRQTPLRFIDITTPIKDDQNTIRGVLGSHINWQWSDEIIQRLKTKNINSEDTEILIINIENKIIYPEGRSSETISPNFLISSAKSGLEVKDNDVSYVSAIAAVESSPLISKLGWRLIARQPSKIALRPVYEMQKTFFVLGITSAIIFVILVIWLAKTLSTPLEKLVHHAKRIEQGEENHSLTIKSNTAEINHLVEAVRGMATTLIQRRKEVVDANLTLEQKVQDRTVELENANIALRLLARRDALTEIDNRLSANERLQMEWLRMKRSKCPYAVLLLDIDYFKRINDSYGHEGGDRVLQQVANILKNSIRITDFVARFGGEEFLILLPEIKKEDGIKIAEKIRLAIANTSIPGIHTVTLSIGLAMADESHLNQDEAVNLADQQLYIAKESGRNRVSA